jgi:hypothetical protein
MLTVKKNTSMANDVLLPEHAEEKRVFFFIIEGADPFCLFREGGVH